MWWWCLLVSFFFVLLVWIFLFYSFHKWFQEAWKVYTSDISDWITLMRFQFIADNVFLNYSLNLGKKNPERKLILSTVLRPYDNLILNGCQEYSLAEMQFGFDSQYFRHCFLISKERNTYYYYYCLSNIFVDYC